LFIDEADITVKAGDGGDGCVAFRRESHVLRGGPSGGDGGHGGDVILRADPSVDTLLDFKGHHHWRAQRGLPGSGSNCTGRSGEDLIIRVPAGTQVFDLDTGLMIRDLVTPGDQFVVAKGGKGGFGNQRFATPTRQTPDFATPGEEGQERRLHLELKLIADVGLLGLPNAGKSTLLSVLSAARPKIADYPFTTTEPCLGIVEASPERRFVMADLPGLIAGAHQGVGLGDRFLKHVERTRLLVHLVEPSPSDGSDPLQNYRTIRHEVAQYSAELAARPEIVVVSKMDLTGADDVRELLQGELGCPVLGISGASHRGLKELVARIVEVLDGRDQKGDSW